MPAKLTANKPLANTETITVGAHTVSYRSLGKGARKILFFHGFPGSSIQLELFRPHLETHDIQVVCMDRPGYNKTSFDQTDQLSLTGNLAKALVDSLGWKKFEVFTVSGGTPSGLSFAHRNPKLVEKISVLCGLAPLHHRQFRRHMKKQSVYGLQLAEFLPGKLAKHVVRRGAKSVDKRPWLFNFLFPTSDADRAIMRENDFFSNSIRIGATEAFAQESAGPKRDAKSFLRHWGWDLGDLKQEISFWHGAEDLLVPPGSSEEMSRHIPHSVLHIVPNEGHYSLPVRQIGNALT